MDERIKVESILNRIDALREEVAALLPEPVVVSNPEPIVAPKIQVVVKASMPEVAPPEPSAFDRFVNRVGDWFAVRGDFAPKGMTREFAVATRWLTRIGAMLLVGAMTYFLMLAINRGWIGPAQRVYGLMFWGLVGTVGGTWIKLRCANYTILGEVFAALGLVALYLSFGLGHRYFSPPVIGSHVAAFLGLAAATVTAGVLSVRLRSLTIAALALVGGFLVPSIARFDSADVFLAVYLAMLTLGASAIAYLRCWSPLSFAALVAAFQIGTYNFGYPVEVVYNTVLLGQSIALTMLGTRRRLSGENGFCWAFVCLASLVWLIDLLRLSPNDPLVFWLWIAAGSLAALAFGVRRWNWAAGKGVPVLHSWAVLYAVIALAIKLCETAAFDWMMPIFALVAVLLGELGLRFKERTLEVFSLILSAILSLAFVGVAVNFYDSTYVYYLFRNGGFLSEIGLRAQNLLPVVAELSFVAIRICAVGSWTAGLRRFVLAVASLFLFVYVSAESGWIGRLYLPTLKTGLMTIVWASTALGLLSLGIVRRIKPIRFVGLGLLCLSVVKILLVDTSSLATAGRVGVFAAVGVLLIVGAFLYLRFRSLFENHK